MLYANSIQRLKIPEGISHSYLGCSPHLMLGCLAAAAEERREEQGRERPSFGPSPASAENLTANS